MLNKVVLIGRLTKDVELKHTSNGTAVAKFTIAVDRRQVKDREKETDFIVIVAWTKLAENCANYIGKGRLVAVSGRLQIRSYEDNQGVRRKAAEIVAEDVKFLDHAKEGNAGGNAGINGDSSHGSLVNFDDEEIPF